MMISVADLRQQLRITHSADDAYLVELEDAAIDHVEDYTGIRYRTPASATEYLIGRGTVNLWLAQEPSSGTPTITEAVVPGEDGDAITDFAVRGSKLVRVDGVWTRGYEYVVTYMRGYDIAPDDVRQAVKELVARWYMDRTGVAQARAVGIPDETRAKLRKRAPRAG